MHDNVTLAIKARGLDSIVEVTIKDLYDISGGGEVFNTNAIIVLEPLDSVNPRIEYDWPIDEDDTELLSKGPFNIPAINSVHYKVSAYSFGEHALTANSFITYNGVTPLQSPYDVVINNILVDNSLNIDLFMSIPEDDTHMETNRLYISVTKVDESFQIAEEVSKYYFGASLDDLKNDLQNEGHFNLFDDFESILGEGREIIVRIRAIHTFLPVDDFPEAKYIQNSPNAASITKILTKNVKQPTITLTDETFIDWSMIDNYSSDSLNQATHQVKGVMKLTISDYSNSGGSDYLEQPTTFKLYKRAYDTSCEHIGVYTDLNVTLDAKTNGGNVEYIYKFLDTELFVQFKVVAQSATGLSSEVESYLVEDIWYSAHPTLTLEKNDIEENEFDNYPLLTNSHLADKLKNDFTKFTFTIDAGGSSYVNRKLAVGVVIFNVDSTRIYPYVLTLSGVDLVNDNITLADEIETNANQSVFGDLLLDPSGIGSFVFYVENADLKSETKSLLQVEVPSSSIKGQYSELSIQLTNHHNTTGNDDEHETLTEQESVYATLEYTTPLTKPLSAPSSISASSGKDKVIAYWSPVNAEENLNNAATGYIVSVFDKNNLNVPVLDSSHCTGVVFVYDTTDYNVKYEFSVKAKNDAGESEATAHTSNDGVSPASTYYLDNADVISTALVVTLTNVYDLDLKLKLANSSTNYTANKIEYRINGSSSDTKLLTGINGITSKKQNETEDFLIKLVEDRALNTETWGLKRVMWRLVSDHHATAPAPAAEIYGDWNYLEVTISKDITMVLTAGETQFVDDTYQTTILAEITLNGMTITNVSALCLPGASGNGDTATDSVLNITSTDDFIKELSRTSTSTNKDIYKVTFPWRTLKLATNSYAAVVFVTDNKGKHYQKSITAISAHNQSINTL